MISLLFMEYFFLRQRIPLFLYVFYIHYRELENPIIDQIMNTLLTFIVLISAYTFLGFIFQIPFRNLIPFNWSYYGLIHWCIFFFFFYLLSIRKYMSPLKSFTLATLATVGGGWLYEIPIFYPESMFIGPLSIFYVNGQILYLLFLGYELMRMNFKPNKIIILMMLIFLAFSTALFVDKYAFWDMVRGILGKNLLDKMIWVYRIPASLLLLSLLSGLKNQKEMNESV